MQNATWNCEADQKNVFGNRVVIGGSVRKYSFEMNNCAQKTFRDKTQKNSPCPLKPRKKSENKLRFQNIQTIRLQKQESKQNTLIKKSLYCEFVQKSENTTAHTFFSTCF